MKSLLITLSVIPLLLLSCRHSRNGIVFKDSEYRRPPGTVQIDTNLFIDQYEITNFNWLEYLYYQEKIYGKASKIYKSCLPDTSIWVTIDTNWTHFSKHYLRHPSTRNYPVVGVTFEQAKLFANWRSDRVFEHSLIKNNTIPFTANLSADSSFTIDKYFTGNYLGIKPANNLIYPQYELIDTITYASFSHFADSINMVNIKFCKKNSHAAQVLFENSNTYHQKTNSSTNQYQPLLPVTCQCRTNAVVPHLYGNVSEMTDLDGIIFGSGFGDTNTIKTFVTLPNEIIKASLIGFRNKCSYVQWSEQNTPQ